MSLVVHAFSALNTEWSFSDVSLKIGLDGIITTYLRAEVLPLGQALGPRPIFWPNDVVDIIASYTDGIINDGDWTLKALVYPAPFWPAGKDLTDEQALVCSAAGILGNNPGFFHGIEDCFTNAALNNQYQTVMYLSGLFDVALSDMDIILKQAFKFDSTEMLSVHAEILRGYDVGETRQIHFNEACKCGSFKIFMDFIENDADEDEKLDIDDETLMLASKGGSLNIVKYLMDIKKLKYKDQLTHEACINGHVELLKYFYEECKGSNPSPNAFDSAIMRGHLEVVQYLENPDTFDNPAAFNNLELSHIFLTANLPMVKYLHSKDIVFHEYLLADACASGSLELVRYMSETNPTFRFGNSCTHHAVKSNNLDLVKYLYEIGVVFGAESRNRSRTCSKEIAKYLWKHT